ncbi:hypothetical protein BC829DRAFT_441563 [Chytridium lagenaria]|nr:hypothetical protein BC829DRAFT_441563 [Chytridium lagenaria]
MSSRSSPPPPPAATPSPTAISSSSEFAISITPSPPSSPLRGDVSPDQFTFPSALSPSTVPLTSLPERPHEAVAWNSEPVGTERVFGSLGVWAYEACPKESTHRAIVLITDAFGWKLPTFRLIADALSKQTNALVIIPDLLSGGLYPTSPHLIAPPPKPTKSATLFTSVTSFISQTITYAISMPQLASMLSRFPESLVLPVLDDILVSLVRDHGISPNHIGVQAYGWGGNLAVQLGGRYPPTKSSDPPRISCFSVSDPSHIPGLVDIRKLKVPSLWCYLDVDHAGFSRAFREATEKALKEKNLGEFVGFWNADVGEVEDLPVGFASRDIGGTRVGEGG